MTENKLVCPFCQQELRPLAIGYCCDCGYCADKDLWKKVITTRKALEIAVDALKGIKDECYDTTDVLLCVNKALEQITALGQKEHFADASKKIEQKDVK